MGSWYRSFSFRGDVKEDLVLCLDRWLRAKGFERQEGGAPLLPPDPRGERGAFLLTSPEWTTLVYSEIEEEERLALELGRLDRPFLLFFVVDSDVWGYELRAGDEVPSAFLSRAGVYDDLPEGPNDLDAFVQVLGLSCRPTDLARLQRKRAVFAEQPAEELLAAIGLSAAGTQYDYVWAGEVEAPGFEKTELRYRRTDFDPMAGFDLHRIEPAPESAADRSREEAARELAERLHSPQIRLMLAVAKVVGWLFRALFWLARPWLRRRMQERLEGAPPGSRPEANPSREAAVLRGNFLEDPHLGFRLTLPAGAEGPEGHRLFRCLGLDVAVQVEPPERVRAVLSSTHGPARLVSRNAFFGPLPAKILVLEDTRRPGAVFRTLVVYVATKRGIYTFRGAAPYGQEPPTQERLEELVVPLSTFELIAPEGVSPTTP